MKKFIISILFVSLIFTSEKNIMAQSQERPVFNLTVDYTKTFNQTIKKGKYGRTMPDTIKYTVPKELVGKKFNLTATLFVFNKKQRSTEIVTKIYKEGYRPAYFMELLSYGYQYPEMQKNFPIVALGTNIIDGNQNTRVPYLYVSYDDRALYMYVDDYPWLPECRFLAIKE